MVQWFIQQYGDSHAIEIETNGTVVPSTFFINLLQKYKVQLNISPKINIKQMEHIDTFPYIINYLTNQEYILKFLLNDQQDMAHIDNFVNKYQIPNDKVWIQPVGINSAQIICTVQKFEQQILDHNYNLSARLHVLLFENQRGK
jgi:hypothetical protein